VRRDSYRFAGRVAYPAKYGNSGIMTFIVNQDGKVLSVRPKARYGEERERDAAVRSCQRVVSSQSALTCARRPDRGLG
jgi:Protein of unknown function (DUF2950)